MKLQSLIAEEPVNTGHQAGLDGLKTISIFFMIMIHVYESVTPYPAENMGVFSSVLEFLDGPFGAPAFMTLMGIGMAYSTHNSPEQLIRRGVQLLIVAYALNFARDTIPTLVNGMITGEIRVADLIDDTFNTDILHLAGLSFLLTGFLKKRKVNLDKTFFIAVVMQAVGTFLLPLKVENTFLKYFLGLFIYTGSASCFPLLLWFIFPAFGMQFGRFLKQVTDLDRFQRQLLCVCLTLFLGLSCCLIAGGAGISAFYSLADDACYKQNFLSAFYSFVLFGLTESVFYFLSKRPWTQKLAEPCHRIGRNLNSIYINQWLVLGVLTVFLRCTHIKYFGFVWLLPLTVGIYTVSAAFAKYTGRFVNSFLSVIPDRKTLS